MAGGAAGFWQASSVRYPLTKSVGSNLTKSENPACNDGMSWVDLSCRATGMFSFLTGGYS